MISDQTLKACIKHRARNARRFASEYPQLERLFKKPKPFILEDELAGLPVTSKRMRSPIYRLIKHLKKLKALLPV